MMSNTVSLVIFAETAFRADVNFSSLPSESPKAVVKVERDKISRCVCV